MRLKICRTTFLTGIAGIDPAAQETVLRALEAATKRVTQTRRDRHSRFEPHRVSTINAARVDVIELLRSGEPVPCQDALAYRWGVDPGTASRWLTQIEREGHVVRRRDGQRWELLAANARERSIIDAGNAEH